MSLKQWKRLSVFERLEKGELTVAEAAIALGLTERWVRALREPMARRGTEALVHGNTGKRPDNRIADKVRKQIVRLRETKYHKFNDHHFTEKLVEVEKIEISRQSVQRILREAGIEAERKRRAPKHRKRRERKAQAGLMILWDGSPHGWLEERGPTLCMMGAVDDATSELLPGAHFVERECSAGYLRVLRDIAREKGIPHIAYMDRHSSLKRNDEHWSPEEKLKGKRNPTQVERALEALDIEIIYAHSPQAKGRVERGWGTHQDRLASELRLAKARTIAAANQVLDRYRPNHNRRFAVGPREATPAWRPVPKYIDLDRVCSFYYEATVGNDNAVRIQGVVIDIPPGPGRRGYAHAKVEVRQLLDGSWRVYYRDALIATGSRPRRRGKDTPSNAASA